MKLTVGGISQREVSTNLELSSFLRSLLRFERLAGTQKSQRDAIRAFGWHSTFAFSLRIPTDYCDSSVRLALNMRILAADSY